MGLPETVHCIFGILTCIMCSNLKIAQTVSGLRNGVIEYCNVIGQSLDSRVLVWLLRIQSGYEVQKNNL